MKLITIFICLLVGSLIHADEPAICLCLVIRDDVEVIDACLESVKEIVDCISICDIGSTDGTVKKIRDFQELNGIPCDIRKFNATKFFKDKKEVAVSACETLERAQFSLEESYLLIMEPNMSLEVGSGFTKEALNADSYSIQERSQMLSLRRYNLALLKAALPWEGVGFAHECWYSRENKNSAKLHSLRISDFGDDAYKIQRMEFDRDQLMLALKLEPREERYIFHLAQVQKYLRNYDEALQLYFARIDLKEARDEVWFSKLMVGECYEEMGHWSHALYWYLDAYQTNPGRPDSLKKISSYYRSKGLNDLAYIFAKHGSRVPYPSDPLLSNFKPLYGYDFDEELSVVSFYTSFKEDGYAASSDLLLRRGVPWYMRDQAYQNLLFYIQNLQKATFQRIKFETPLIQQGFDERFYPMNPTIVKTETGYSVICRTVNYTQTGAKFFHTLDAKGVYRTKNFFLQYDKEFNLVSQREVLEDLPRQKFPSFCLEGLDDCRLFRMNGSYWFTCTTTDTSPGNHQVSLCKLSDSLGRKTVDVETLTPLIGPDLNRCEKNWLPFLKDGELQLIYSCAPFTIYKPNIETGVNKTVLQYGSVHEFSSFRGSAPPIEFDRGYLMMVHEVLFLKDYQRCYIHRLVFLDKDFVVQKVSKPFTFLHSGVEFCCGMTLDHEEEKLVITIGIEDHEAYLCFVDVDTVRNLLCPLPPNG